MPCWCTTMISTKLDKINMSRALTALKSAGATIYSRESNKDYIDFSFNGIRGTVFSDGKVSSDNPAVFVKIYAEQTLKEAAKRFGWRVTSKVTTKTGLSQLKLGR